MADYICVGGIADVFVEFHGEEDTADSTSGSDFEDEYVILLDEDPGKVITAEPAEYDAAFVAEPDENDEVIAVGDAKSVENDKIIATEVAESDEMVEMFVPNNCEVIPKLLVAL
jgi:hypothetical protein